MKKTFYRTDFLLSKVSFWLGFGSILAIFDPFYTFNYSESEQQADRTAIESDFGTVGEDIRKAMAEYGL